MARGTLHAGTSGYAYKEWKPAFYPADLAQSKFLAYYASRLTTVEINNTFYRFPSGKNLAEWRDGTPEGFTFAVKANQRITHIARLKEAQLITGDFIERCRELGSKLGPILFQLPPNLKRDDERLAAFVGPLPKDVRCAVEFRHASWFDEPVFAILREAGVALCVSEGEKIEPPRIATAPFCYVRLRKERYGEAELLAWRDWIGQQIDRGRDVFCYLKHDAKGESPELALRMLGP